MVGGLGLAGWLAGWLAGGGWLALFKFIINQSISIRDFMNYSCYTNIT